MAIRQIQVERFSITSSKPFEDVIAALQRSVGDFDFLVNG